MTHRPALALVSLKSYFSHAETLKWCDYSLKIAAKHAPHAQLMVLPSVTALALLGGPATDAGVKLGAQDCSMAAAGATTGEVPASLLKELGVSAVMVGHAERRSEFGDDESIIARKVEAVVANGMIPVVCVGERDREHDPVETVVKQLESAIERVPSTEPIVALYEPVWAIGADAPADADHIRSVATAIRETILPRSPMSSVLYGGAAGPGMFSALSDVLDGLGLGRTVHDPRVLDTVLEELAGVVEKESVAPRRRT